jgi:hypothetical protein
VFSGPHLVGTVIAVPQGYERSLVARRIEPIADDASLHEARGQRWSWRLSLAGSWARGSGICGSARRTGCAPSPAGVEELAWLRQAAGDPVVVTQALAGRASGRSL